MGLHNCYSSVIETQQQPENEMDTSHLVALHTRLSHERSRLAVATKENEKALRSVWVEQIEKEISDEMARLGMSAELPEMTDDELFAALNA